MAVVLSATLAGTGVVRAEAAVKWQSIAAPGTLTGDCATGLHARLSSGSSGEAVESAQCLLNRHGNYNLTVNGRYDARSP